MHTSCFRLLTTCLLAAGVLSASPALGQSFTFEALGPRVVPPNLTLASANAVVVNAAGTVTVTGSWVGMCGAVTAVDIRSSVPVIGVSTTQCTNGPLVFTVPFVNGIGGVGSFAGVFIPAPADLAALLACDLYLEIQTGCGDAVRGQIENGWRYCNLCDAGLAACPCANPGLDETGCENGHGTGGVRLKAVDYAPTASPGTALFEGSGFPPSTFTAFVLIRSVAPALIPFGDGVRCIGVVGLARVGATTSSFGTGTMAYTHNTGPGHYYYQLWYRSTGFYCTPAFHNLSSALILQW